jgi:hypothetical protein
VVIGRAMMFLICPVIIVSFRQIDIYGRNRRVSTELKHHSGKRMSLWHDLLREIMKEMGCKIKSKKKGLIYLIQHSPAAANLKLLNLQKRV